MFTKHNSFRRGVTLVELMIAMLILAIVCVAWLEIIGIQSARKEARRREAVERLAGMMDAFMYINKDKVSEGFYRREREIASVVGDDKYTFESVDGEVITFKAESDGSQIRKVFSDDVSPVGYRLYAVKRSALGNPTGTTANEKYKFAPLQTDTEWGSKSVWLVGELYDHDGEWDKNKRPFFALSVCTGL